MNVNKQSHVTSLLRSVWRRVDVDGILLSFTADQDGAAGTCSCSPCAFVRCGCDECPPPPSGRTLPRILGALALACFGSTPTSLGYRPYRRWLHTRVQSRRAVPCVSITNKVLLRTSSILEDLGSGFIFCKHGLDRPSSHR